MSGFVARVKSWASGLYLLRQPELVRYLGQRQADLRLLAALRAEFPGARLADDLELTGYEAGRLQLASGSLVCRGTVLSFGDARNGVGSIAIGENSWIGPYNNLRACGVGSIEIGSDCLVSQFCTLAASNHGIARGELVRVQPPAPDRLGIVVGDDVWLGAGAVVLPGVRLGDGCVVGAQAVVNRDVPAYEIWAGVPGRKVGERS